MSARGRVGRHHAKPGGPRAPCCFNFTERRVSQWLGAATVASARRLHLCKCDGPLRGRELYDHNGAHRPGVAARVSRVLKQAANGPTAPSACRAALWEAAACRRNQPSPAMACDVPDVERPPRRPRGVLAPASWRRRRGWRRRRRRHRRRRRGIGPPKGRMSATRRLREPTTTWSSAGRARGPLRGDDDDMSMVSSASRSGRKVKRKSERRALVDKGAPKTYGKCAAAAASRSKVRCEGFYEL